MKSIKELLLVIFAVITLLLCMMIPFGVSAFILPGDIAHTGVFNDGGTLQNNVLKWNYRFGSCLPDVADNSTDASPAVVNEVVYIGGGEGNTQLFAIGNQTSLDPLAPVANFTGTPLSGTVPLGVTFSDSSTGPSITNWLWDFGDGNISSYSVPANPFHSYSNPGNYTVNLTVTGANGTDSEVKVNYIRVSDNPAIHPASEIGVFRNSSGNWYLNFNNNGVVDKTFHFGASGDIPVVGDWNGNGTSDIGVFRPSSGNWYLDYNKTGQVDKTFHFGTTGDIPVVGDWDGNRISDISVFRPSNGNWYFDTTRTGIVNKTFHFGASGDIPVAGDWNGDGTSDIGVFRPSNGNWYLNYTVQQNVSQTTQSGVKTFSLRSMPELNAIQDNNKITRLLQNTTINKKNLTEGQKKLSTSLLMQISSSNGLQSASDTLLTKNLVYVYISVKPGYSTHIIDSFVSEVPNRDEDNHLAVAWTDVQNLDTLASVAGVRAIQEVIPPVVNIGSVTTEGDVIHKTANVRSTYGNTGAGMKIGIISDGVDHLAASIASGDLPADTTVLSNTLGGDEGTAMLEIVHDMVPDAKLYFHDAGSNTVAFNSAVDELRANGCTVICDDVSWVTEPFFEDGIVATHVSSVISGNQIIYVSSAGNDAKEHYQGDFSDDGHGFNDKYLYVNMPTGSSVRVVLEWNDQFGHSANDYDLVLFDAASGAVLSSSTNTQSGTQDPLETLSYTNSGSSRDVEIEVFKDAGVGKTLEIYIYPSDGAGVYNNNIVAEDSIFGQKAIPDVIAVAAVPASSPSSIEPFSSRGPVTIAYPNPEGRSKPDISGVDGVSVTGAGGFPTRFNGTSAAAPHIAAVIAQYWGAHPSLSPAQVRSALYNYSIDLGTPGKDTIFGNGRADAWNMATNSSGNNEGGNNAIAEKTFHFGTTGDMPVVSDWDSDGISDVGVFRTSNGNWYLDTTRTGIVNKTFHFGTTGDVPVIGDWDNNGISDIGVFRPSNGNWYLDTTRTGVVNETFHFGTNGDNPLVGKWV